MKEKTCSDCFNCESTYPFDPPGSLYCDVVEDYVSASGSCGSFKENAIQPSTDAIKKCAEDLNRCLGFGWPKSSMDRLEEIWWDCHDDNGDVSNTATQPVIEADAEKRATEIQEACQSGASVSDIMQTLNRTT